MDINKIKDLIRIGRVSSVNPLKCTAKVTFPDKDNMVSDELPIVNIGSNKTKMYWMPAIDTQVLCIFLPNNSGKGINDGFILGCIYSDKDIPVEQDEKVVSINFDDGSYMRFANGNIEIHASKAIKITAPRIDLNGGGNKATRLGDSNTGHDICPPTTLASGSDNVYVNNKKAGRVGDSYIVHSCKNHPPHTGVITSGSNSVYINNKQAGRVNDSVSCGGNVASGSNDVYIGE